MADNGVATTDSKAGARMDTLKSLSQTPHHLGQVDAYKEIMNMSI